MVVRICFAWVVGGVPWSCSQSTFYQFLILSYYLENRRAFVYICLPCAEGLNVLFASFPFSTSAPKARSDLLRCLGTRLRSILTPCCTAMWTTRKASASVWISSQQEILRAAQRDTLPETAREQMNFRSPGGSPGVYWYWILQNKRNGQWREMFSYPHV